MRMLLSVPIRGVWALPPPRRDEDTASRGSKVAHGSPAHAWERAACAPAHSRAPGLSRPLVGKRRRPALEIRHEKFLPARMWERAFVSHRCPFPELPPRPRVGTRRSCHGSGGPTTSSPPARGNEGRGKVRGRKAPFLPARAWERGLPTQCAEQASSLSRSCAGMRNCVSVCGSRTRSLPLVRGNE